MKRSYAILLVALLAPGGFCQSFNIDVDSSSVPGISTVPGPMFGGATNQLGYWTPIAGMDLGPFILYDLAGNEMSVTCTRDDWMGGIFQWDNPLTTGDFEALMDDGHYVDSGRSVTYTFSGLAAGTYRVVTYAWSPIDPTWMTRVTMNSESMIIGGGLPGHDTFANGTTHATAVINVAPGDSIAITCEALRGSATLNGIQILKDYRFVMRQASSRSDIIVSDSGGVPGNYFVNLMTLERGSFPYGSIFGIDITISEVLFQVNFGAPFFGILDVEGSATFAIPPPLPVGATVYCVGLQVDTSAGGVISVTTPFSYTLR